MIVGTILAWHIEPPTIAFHVMVLRAPTLFRPSRCELWKTGGASNGHCLSANARLAESRSRVNTERNAE